MLAAGLAAGTSVGLIGVFARADQAAAEQALVKPATPVATKVGYGPFGAVGAIGGGTLAQGSAPPAVPPTTAPPITQTAPTVAQPAPTASQTPPPAAQQAPPVAAPPVAAPPVVQPAPPVTAPPVTAPPTSSTGAS